MLTYENLSSKLLEQIRNVGLEAYNIKNNLEIHTLNKEFKCNCVVTDNKPPHISRAEISFGWDSYLTATSVYGDNCFLFHDDSIDCIHNDLEAEVFIELYIEYNIEVEKEYENDFNTIFNELMKMFRKNMQHENLPNITWKVTTNESGQAFISSIVAEHYWEIELNDNEVDFEGIFGEVKDNLQDIELLPFIKRKY